MNNMRKILVTLVFCLTLLVVFYSHLLNASEVENDSDIPIVLTPTRLKQAIADVPGSVTIITSQTLNNFGIRSVPDALRLVPGMAVTQLTGNDYRINYHGTNILVPRRMNVMIDGISVYGQGTARVNWKILPVAIENIERIEVMRGSDAATYGANSMLAVINIITKNPNDVEGIVLSVVKGSINSLEAMLQYGGKLGDATSFSITADYQGDDGFNYASSKGLGRDNTRFGMLNFHSMTQIAHDETLDLQASLARGNLQIEYVDNSQQTFPDEKVTSYLVNAMWKKNISDNHLIQFQTYATHYSNDQTWRSCLPAAYLLPELFYLSQSNPSYASALLAGKVPTNVNAQDSLLIESAKSALALLGNSKYNNVCADTNQNTIENRYDGEIQDIFVFSDRLRVVNGVGFRYDNAVSETFFGKLASNRIMRAFTNVEYKPFPLLTINAGGFLEKDSLSGSSFSPRLALNTHISDHSTIRFVVSKTVRKPDMLEQRANWSYPTSNYSIPVQGAVNGHYYVSAISPKNLVGEKIFSKEIGYNGNFSHLGVVVDIKIFEDQLSDLISEKLQNSDFTPTNSNSVNLRGSELEFTYNPTDTLTLHLGYSYLINNATNLFEQTQYARNSGSIAASYLSKNNWRSSFAYYGYGSDTNSQTFYGREDIVFQKDFLFGRRQLLTPSFTISHLDNSLSTFLVNVGQRRVSSYTSPMQYTFSLKYTF